MKLIPNRKMRLGGQHVEAGKPVDVPAEDGALAVRMGWAVAEEAKPARRGKAEAKTEPTDQADD
jgi:hypothetical protein